MFDQFLNSFWVLLLALIWMIPWKGWALWRAARNSHKKWFIFLLLINSFALFEIIYIFIFSGYGKKPKIGPQTLNQANTEKNLP